MVCCRLLIQIVVTLSTVIHIYRSECIISRDRYCNGNDYACQRKEQTNPNKPGIKCTNSSISEISIALKQISYNRYGQPVKQSKLFVSNSNITALEPNSESWSDITELHFEHTNTSHIVPGFFKNVNNLQILDISNNQLHEIIDGVFSSFRELLKLNLSSNCIASLKEHSFSGLLDLKVLDLSNNKISAVPNDVFRYQSYLEQVNLSRNHLKDVGNIFSHNPLVTTINFSKNQIISFNFLQLQDKNNLQHLDLSENLLQNFNTSASINMNENMWKEISITSFNISHNFLKSINENICCSNVQVLDISYNNISEITSFENISHLEYLYLQHNNLKSVPVDAFNKMENLTYLDLSFNTISQISFGFFNNLYELQYLDLSDNHMFLDFHTLLTLVSLRVLQLQNNMVKNFDPNLFVTHFKFLERISLGNELWNCTQLTSTINLLKTKNINISKGNNTKISNILGIACEDKQSLKEEDIIFTRDNQISSQSNDMNNKESSMQRFFDRDFKNTTFYRFFQNFLVQYPLQNRSYVTSNDKSEFSQYLNENFTKSNFYQYLEMMRGFENRSYEANMQLQNDLKAYLNENHNMSFILTQLIKNQTMLNTDKTLFLDPNIKKLLVILTQLSENYKKSLTEQNEMSQNVKSILNVQNASLNRIVDILENLNGIAPRSEHQALTDEHSIENYNRPYQGNLVISNVLLVLILFSILGLVYYNIFWKPRRNESRNEQVQLM